MENTRYVIQGLTLLTESLVLPKIVSRYLPVNFVTISTATLLFENLRFLVSVWDTIVQCNMSVLKSFSYVQKAVTLPLTLVPLHWALGPTL